jgi:hypothetical protein
MKPAPPMILKTTTLLASEVLESTPFNVKEKLRLSAE